MFIRLLFFFLSVLVGHSLLAGPRIDRLNKLESSLLPDESQPYRNPNTTKNWSPIILEGPKMTGDYGIGPEIVMTGLSGFYDYQTNGDAKHQINRFNATNMHGVMMLSTDSIDQNGSRRTKYSYSSNNGTTWTDFGQVPTIRSGFVSLTTASNGAAIIGNHYVPTGTQLVGVCNVDLGPGIGSFTPTVVPFNGIWPGVTRMSNNNVLVAMETYVGALATDTGFVCVYNPVAGTMSNATRLHSGASVQTNMRWTYAAGPSGNCIYVLDNIGETGGTFGGGIMYKFTSTNNGISWSSSSILHNEQVVGTDTISPFFGLDAIYDAAGNYYVAFNSTGPSGLFASAVLWVSKNGGTPVRVTGRSPGVNQNTNAIDAPLHADAGIVGFDHPALCLSSDGNTLFIAYSVQHQNDTLNGFNKCHIYYSYSPTAALVFATPIQVTNSGPGSFDERYASLSQTGVANGAFQDIYLAYQKDPQPGSCAFNDAAPISRSTMIHRKITEANNPIGIISIGSEIPQVYSLSQNYPNPFNPTTNIRFALPTSGNVTLKVYDIMGREVATLINNQFVAAGLKEIDFNAANLASGIYLYQIKAGDFTATKKMILTK